MNVDPRSTAGLTPPASDESDKKDDSGSELSDLEEPNGEIEPDHYWGNGSIPVFKPVRYFSLRFPCALHKKGAVILICGKSVDNGSIP